MSQSQASPPKQIQAEALVVGGGPAGAAVAILLAEAGRSVFLVERTARAQHKVCGEFLSAEAVSYLQHLALDPRALGAVPISAVRVAGRKLSHASLPFAALSVTRRTLDEALLQRAADAGVTVLRGTSVRSLQRDVCGWRAIREDAAPILAPAAFLATGKHDLRGHGGPPGPQDDLVAFKMYWQLAPEQSEALREHVELLLFPAGYAGLQPVEGGAANLCCLIRRGELRRLRGGWESLLTHMRAYCPHLRKRLGGAALLLERPLALSAIPYGWLRSEPAPNGLWAVGDQAAVIPSFTGDGMSMALHSGCLAACMYLGGKTPEAFQARFARTVRRQVKLATAVSQGMVREPSRVMLETAASLWPGSLRLLAASTRLPQRDRLA